MQRKFEIVPSEINMDL